MSELSGKACCSWFGHRSEETQARGPAFARGLANRSKDYNHNGPLDIAIGQTGNKGRKRADGKAGHKAAPALTMQVLPMASGSPPTLYPPAC
jgi:hypothetical protein